MNSSVNLKFIRGQALLEALCILSFGIALLLGIHATGLLRSQTLTLLGLSSYRSFLFDKEVVSGDYANVTLAVAPYSGQHQEIEQQIGIESTKMLRASARVQPSQIGFGKSLTVAVDKDLVRHSYLLIGAGQAASALQAQETIANAQTLWKRAYAKSEVQVRLRAHSLNRLDGAWGRGPLTADWLLPWANDVPVAKPIRQVPEFDLIRNVFN